MGRVNLNILRAEHARRCDLSRRCFVIFDLLIKVTCKGHSPFDQYFPILISVRTHILGDALILTSGRGQQLTFA
jgi:hypothetical protein